MTVRFDETGLLWRETGGEWREVFCPWTADGVGVNPNWGLWCQLLETLRPGPTTTVTAPTVSLCAVLSRRPKWSFSSSFSFRHCVSLRIPSARSPKKNGKRTLDV